jgi:SAM-dependent methyltransferase
VTDMPSCTNKIYRNRGNQPLLMLIDQSCMRILDIGCGAGDNAALLRSSRKKISVYGITVSPEEATIATHWMDRCYIADVEQEIPAGLEGLQFDALLFSHVLEHMRDPAVVLSRFLPYLSNHGQVFIAVPNVLFCKTRLQFLLGRFQYESDGILDDTHFRFFTYYTAGRILLSKSPSLHVVKITVSGNVPLGLLRHHIPSRLSGYLDQMCCRVFPNLFGRQILIKAEYKRSQNDIA